MEPLPQELQNLEQQLRTLVPQAPQTSPEQLLYQAGWAAALAQQTATATASPAAPRVNATRRTNSYWAAACAALLLLCTALGWQVWQQPPAGSSPPVAAVPATPQTTTKPAPALAGSTPAEEPEESRFTTEPPSALANYLELRQRITRGGLSMWPVSTPVQIEDAESTPARDWQAELLRETL